MSLETTLVFGNPFAQDARHWSTAVCVCRTFPLDFHVLCLQKAKHLETTAPTSRVAGALRTPPFALLSPSFASDAAYLGKREKPAFELCNRLGEL